MDDLHNYLQRVNAYLRKIKSSGLSDENKKHDRKGILRCYNKFDRGHYKVIPRGYCMARNLGDNPIPKND